MLRQMIQSDYDTALPLVARINRSSAKYFAGNFGTERFRGFVYEANGIQGVVDIIEEDNFFLMHVSFTDIPMTAELQNEVLSLVNDVINRKGTKDLYLNFYGGNKSLITFFRAHGFKEDMTGYQFRYQACQSDGSQVDLCVADLEEQPFDEQDADKYLRVIDRAFEPLDVALGLQINGSARNRTKVITWLKQSAEEGNFCSFWRGGRLLGLYVLIGDWIHTIAVDPEYQNQGLGSVMLKHALHRLFHEKHYTEIFLNCLEINQPGLHYYTKNDFQVVGYFSENTYRPEQ